MIFDLILEFDLPKKIIHGRMILLLDRWMDEKLYIISYHIIIITMIFNGHFTGNTGYM